MNSIPSGVNGRTASNQFFRYAVIGIVSNVSGYLIYLLLTYIGMSPKVVMTLLYGTGAAISYFGNRALTFSYEGSMLGSGFRFILSHLAGYVINLGMLVLFVDMLGYPHQLVQAMAVLIVAAFLFVALKFFVFEVA